MAAPLIRYGIQFPNGTTEAGIEIHMVRKGGQWKTARGNTFGNGLYFHFKKLESILWPTEKKWHRWNELQLREYLEPANRIIGIMGPSSSGKTNGSATDILTDYYCFPECTTVLVCSTTKERMQDRIFGEIKKYHRLARARFPNLPGHAIDGRMRIVTESADEAKDGRDFRNGITGVPCLIGGDFRGISEFIGIKNERVRVIFDELQMLPPAVLLALSNLDKNPNFKVVGLGNPKETTDALGTLCEPIYEIGGWDGNIDQTPETKTWKTHYGGICIQLVGTDSPNYDGKLGIPLICKDDIDRDIARYGKDSLKFTMMNQGMMPRGQGSRRVLTRQMAIKHGAMEDPQWLNSERIKIGALDAAFGGVGGDRCVFVEMQFGYESNTINPNELDITNLTNQKPTKRTHKQALALIDLLIVPVKAGMKDELPEDQIVSFVKEQCVTRNIPPQNFYFDAGMRSSLVSAFARLWSPQTNPIDCGGTPSDRPVSAKITTPCKQYYSKFVTELWFSVRLIVEGGQFRRMTEAPLSEFCRREWTTVGNNKTEVESKADMKEKFGKSPDCFVAGTLISTDRGQVPIEEIRIGDLITTPFGLSPVLEVHKSKCDTLTTVTFSNGSNLRGKGKHKIFTWDNGWVRMDALSLTNDIESVTDIPLWNIANLFFTVASNTGFKTLVDTIKMETRLRRRDFYTELYGLNGVELFRPVIACITKMAIGGITGLKIWNSCQYLITQGITWLRGFLTRITEKKTSGTFQKLLPLPWRGINPKTAGSGIENMQKMCGLEELKPQPPPAPSAGKLSKHSARTLQGSAPFGASISSREKPKRNKGNALFAELLSLVLSIPLRRIVPTSVQTSQTGSPVEVFNLTLLEHNAYYANGILVQNCADAIAIACEGARRLGFQIDMPVAREFKRQDDKWKSELKNKAAKSWREGALTYK